MKDEIELIGQSAIDDRLKVLECDFDAFWNDSLLGNKQPDPKYAEFLGNMMLSINFHIGCFHRRTPCFKHPKPGTNIPVKFSVSQDDIDEFVCQAWCLVGKLIRKHDPDHKLTHLYQA